MCNEAEKRAIKLNGMKIFFHNSFLARFVCAILEFLLLDLRLANLVQLPLKINYLSILSEIVFDEFAIKI